MAGVLLAYPCSGRNPSKEFSSTVAASLAALVVIYFFVFGAGTFYVVRLMARTPQTAPAEEPADKRSRASGLMPGPALGQIGETRP